MALTSKEIKKLKGMIKPSYMIKGQKYKVVWKKDIVQDGGTLWGYCHCLRKQIVFSEKAHFGVDQDYEWIKNRLKHTFFHELGHAIFEESGFHQTALDNDYFELITENFATVMVGITKKGLFLL